MNSKIVGIALSLSLASACGGDDGTSARVVGDATVLQDASAVHDAAVMDATTPPTSDAGAVATADASTDATVIQGVDSGTLPLDGAQIAGILSASNVASINLGMLAATLAHDGAVIAYANTVVNASIDAQDREGTLLQTLGLTPEDSDVTTALGTETQQATDALNAAAPGTAFDYAYLANEVKRQQSYLDLIDHSLLIQVQDPDLTAFVQSTRSIVLMQLDAAKQLLATYQVAADGGVTGGPADAGL